MARQKALPDPPDDIPAWFMTYSDVITLLMTFFILLLTFATTEPERFEKSVSSTFSSGAATGLAGNQIDGISMDSWINRMRPPSARIAMRGAEMPPIMKAPPKTTFGEGLRSLTSEEEKQNELTSHHFDVPLSQVFDSQGELTPNGKQICRMLSTQLDALPFQAAIQFADAQDADRITGLMAHLFDIEKIRPGQASMSMIRKTDLADNNLRILIKRFSRNQP